MSSHSPSRRRLVEAAAFGALAFPFRHLQAGGSGMRARIESIIREYSDQGDHRTGTDTDAASARWLAARIARLGIEPELSTFAFRRLVVRDAALLLDELEIRGVPLFDGGVTDAAGVTGRLGPVGSDAAIGVGMTLPVWSTASGKAIARARRSGRHAAIVIVSDERLPADGIALINAEHFGEPFGPPVLQVANRHAREIFRAAETGATGRVVAHCEYAAGTASNVGARVAGHDASRPPLIVMTPRSGWWRCASERGGGIAAFLEIARATAMSRPARDVVFTANTGHELGHIGLEHFLAEHGDWARGAAAWIHLGANFAARVMPGVRLQFSDTDLREALAPIMAAERVAAASVTPIGTAPRGEARNIHERGGRYVSILGRNGLFHHPDDVWPSAVDLEETCKWVSVFTRLAVQLAGVGPSGL